MTKHRFDAGLTEARDASQYVASVTEPLQGNRDIDFDDEPPQRRASFTDTARGSTGTSAPFRDFVKRALDIQIAFSLLVVLFPLLLITVLIVMSDGGSPVFGHPRVGRGGRKFRCLKFRTMVKHSDAVLEHLLATDQQAREEWNRAFKLKNDIRVTPIGRILRKTSLDELPQLWNVLRGDMSLVGPRPIVEKELAKYGDDLRYYLMVKPGVTGLWQVSGRSNLDYERRVALDVDYVKRSSLALDVSILLRTLKVVFERDGAY
jgi:Undecaprenyl-phosphate galactose phosphotransferase WbaP